jgi:GntR family transcriptional regulator
MLTIRLDSPVPIGDQILTGIRRLIAAGRLKPGDELPPVRQLAADLGVNLNTVARAYRALEQDGLVSSIRGRGTRVTADRESSRPISPETKQRITSRVRDALADVKLAGLKREEARKIIESVVNEYWFAAT